jgi:hypothetical protein
MLRARAALETARDERIDPGDHSGH